MKTLLFAAIAAISLVTMGCSTYKCDVCPRNHADDYLTYTADTANNIVFNRQEVTLEKFYLRLGARYNWDTELVADDLAHFRAQINKLEGGLVTGQKSDRTWTNQDLSLTEKEINFLCTNKKSPRN